MYMYITMTSSATQSLLGGRGGPSVKLKEASPHQGSNIYIYI